MTVFIIMISIMVTMALAICQRKRNINKLLFMLFSPIYVFMVAYVIQFVLLVVGYGRPRICYPIGALVGILILNYLLNIVGVDYANVNESGNILSYFKTASVIGIYLFCILYVIILYVEFQKDILNKYTTNARDMYTVEIIGDRIVQYEKETGNVIESITFYKDANVHPGYHDVVFVQDVMIRSFYEWYSDLNSINYYLGTNYKKGAENGNIRKFFESNDWDTFSYEQLIFDDNELHICMY